MKGEEMEYDDYYRNMKNYFLDIAKIEKNKLLNKYLKSNNIQNNNVNNSNEEFNLQNKINGKKIIYIQDSALQIRSKLI
jgi:hypothetical protein